MEWLRKISFWAAIAGIVAWTGWFLAQSRHEPRVEFPLSGEFVAVEGIKLYAQFKGEGRWVLLLHGFPYHSEAFQGLLAKPWPGCRVVALDLPGLGLSEREPGASFAPDELALVVKLFLDKLGVKEADVVGHDLGGGVAMILAADYPTLVRHAVLIAPDSALGQAATAEPVWWRWPVLGEIWSLGFSARGFLRDVLARSWTPRNRDWEGLVEQYAEAADSIEGRQGLLALERGRRGFDYRPYQERLRAPILLLWGEDDRILPPEVGRLLAQRLTGAELRVLPGVGHLPPEEAPDQVYEVIRQFLAMRTAPVPKAVAERSGVLETEADVPVPVTSRGRPASRRRPAVRATEPEEETQAAAVHPTPVAATPTVEAPAATVEPPTSQPAAAAPENAAPAAPSPAAPEPLPASAVPPAAP
jgi:pimeloyl-ACP methyl ester carboxylesterase